VARIALKVDVDTLRGTREGALRLVDVLAGAAVRATFLWSLGPDHTGWALRRLFRPGFFAKVSRTSVLEHYGLRTLLYGVALPAPDIGIAAAPCMRAVRDAGHECGIHAWDHVLWQDNVRHRGAAWTERQMQLAFDRFVDVFGARPATHGAAGWQMNPAAFRQLDAWGFAYASDGRGTGPYVPQVDGMTLAHVQLPTTLPTLDELLGVDGRDERAVVAEILRRTESDRDQVFTLHAELEGGRLAGAFAALLAGWREQGHALGTLADLFATLDRPALPVRRIGWAEVPGRSGELVVARAVHGPGLRGSAPTS
jgi:peptidoglycan/xylan/chitin deacetylase (PgdA/CDA1 family)